MEIFLSQSVFSIYLVLHYYFQKLGLVIAKNSCLSVSSHEYEEYFVDNDVIFPRYFKKSFKNPHFMDFSLLMMSALSVHIWQHTTAQKRRTFLQNDTSILD